MIYVPAVNGPNGAYDRDVGHYRRYSKRRSFVRLNCDL